MSNRYAILKFNLKQTVFDITLKIFLFFFKFENHGNGILEINSMNVL
jgi:hypothetical protein